MSPLTLNFDNFNINLRKIKIVIYIEINDFIFSGE